MPVYIKIKYCMQTAGQRHRVATVCGVCLRVDDVLEEEPGAELEGEEGRQRPDLTLYHRLQYLTQLIMFAHFSNEFSREINISCLTA